MTLDSLEDGDRPKPDGWTETNLGEVCRHKSGNSHLIKGKLHDRPGEGLFQAFSASGPDVWHTDWEHEGPAIVVSAVGARCGKAFRADGRWSAVANTHVVRTDPQRLDRDYAFLMLNDESFWVKSGSAQPFVKVGETLARPILLPPLPEQRRIVGKIEELLASANAAYQRLARVPAILKRFRQSVLAAAFFGHLTGDWRANQHDLESGVDLLRRCARVTASDPRNKRLLRRKTPGLAEAPPPGDLPTEWGLATVRELLLQGALLDFQDGNHGELYPRKEDFGGLGVKFLTAAQVMNNRVLFEDAPRLKDEKASTLRIGFAQPGDVLLTHNATVGRVAILRKDTERCILGTSVTYYRFRRAFVNPEFVCYAMQSELWQCQLRMVMEQTTRNQVSVKKQIELWLPVAPIAEQHEIVNRVRSLFALADTIEQRVAAAMARADRLTQAILARAFRGELVPTDAELARRAARQLTSVPTCDTSK